MGRPCLQIILPFWFWFWITQLQYYWQMIFFGQNQIQAFGMINFVPDSIVVAASMGDSILENSSPVPGTIEYIKSKVLEKYHGFLNLFFDKEATTLPPPQDQDMSIELEEGKVPPFGLIYSLTPTEKAALHSYLSKNLAKGFYPPFYIICCFSNPFH